jgi:hypothetical protein
VQLPLPEQTLGLLDKREKQTGISQNVPVHPYLQVQKS